MNHKEIQEALEIHGCGLTENQTLKVHQWVEKIQQFVHFGGKEAQLALMIVGIGFAEQYAEDQEKAENSGRANHGPT